MQRSDLELVRAAADGDGEAFRELVDRHAKALFRVAMRLTPTRSDAEDVLQEGLSGAYRSLKSFAGQSSVKTWLTRIVMKQAARQWQKGKHARRTMSIEGLSESADRVDGLRSRASGEAGVDHRLDLAVALNQLSEEHREVLTLRELQGLSYEEIAAAIGVPRGTVESRLFRARAELRQRLKEYA